MSAAKKAKPEAKKQQSRPAFPFQIINDAKLGKEVKVYNYTNLYGCEIGENTQVACFVEIQRGVRIGKDCKIEAFAFIPTGVTIGNRVFIGPHACFTNDIYPRATNPNGTKKTASDWKCVPTVVRDGASIGANSVIRCGVTIGENSMVGAGSVVLKDVPANTLVAGNPAKEIKKING